MFDFSHKSMNHSKGVVAAGHSTTAEAARQVLRDGGNAFDAVLAAVCAACVAEPVLASLGGGGFLLAHTGDNRARVYDFFVHTPRQFAPVDETDFYPILADFGPVQQEFHIGRASMATPGMVKGIFAIHRDLCTLPLSAIVAPAILLAQKGVRLNAFQSHIFEIVRPIYLSSPEAQREYASASRPGDLVRHGEALRLPELADIFDALAREGDALFYEGEIATTLAQECRENGGLINEDDLRCYRVAKRRPLCLRYRDARIETNPPPSCGGVLIAFALELLSALRLPTLRCGSAEHLACLAQVMALSQEARLEQRIDEGLGGDRASNLLDARLLERYRHRLQKRIRSSRGTTQISVADNQGNLASMTVSNGEGSGFIIPQTGIMMNNMLGEADLHPHGFHNWQPDQRIVSMMAPSLVFGDDGRAICTGSGGSNRIRTAILQVLSNLLDFGMSLENAVHHPRIHFEDDLLNIEGGFAQSDLERLKVSYPRQKVWSGTHLFFGGAHTVSRDGATAELAGVGDPRRGGVSVIV